MKVKGFITVLMNRLQSTSHCGVAGSVRVEEEREGPEQVPVADSSPSSEAIQRVGMAETQSPLSKEVLEAVVETKRRRQRQDLTKWPLDGKSFAAPAVLAAGQHRNGRERRRLHQTR